MHELKPFNGDYVLYFPLLRPVLFYFSDEFVDARFFLFLIIIYTYSHFPLNRRLRPSLLQSAKNSMLLLGTCIDHVYFNDLVNLLPATATIVTMTMMMQAHQ